MTTKTNFIPATNDLGKHCAAALRSTADLVASMLSGLPQDKLQAIDNLLAGGGSVGMEILTDYKAQNTLRLVALEREGARLVLATVTTQEPPAAAQ